MNGEAIFSNRRLENDSPKHSPQRGEHAILISSRSCSRCCLSESPHHVLARDDAQQFAPGAYHRKAATLEAHHHLENPSQWRSRFDVHDSFSHHTRDLTVHELVVVRHHLTRGEGENLQK